MIVQLKKSSATKNWLFIKLNIFKPMQYIFFMMPYVTPSLKHWQIFFNNPRNKGIKINL